MQLRDAMEAQGLRLFRMRSFLPFLFLAPFGAALAQAQWLESSYGDTLDDVYDWTCVAVSALGASVRFFVAGTVPRRTSGRNTGKGQVADRLNTTGVYSVVRHPLYLGNFLLFLGIVMAPGVWWLVAIGALVFCLYYERIMLAEESFLRGRFGSEYIAWADRTPAIVPAAHLWTRPGLPFCIRTAVKREYLSVLSVVTCFAALDYLEDLASIGWSGLEWESDTTLPFIAMFVVCVAIRFLRKRTKVLSIPGR